MSNRLAEMARSLTPGARSIAYGDSTVGRWPHDELQALLGAPTVFLAHGGDSMENTAWMVEQTNPAAAAAIPTVLVSVGTANLRADDRCAFTVRARALMSLVRRRFPKARIYYIGLYQKGLYGRAIQGDVVASNDVLQQTANSLGIRYVDVYDPIARACLGQASCTLLEPNRVHPSDAGYVVISRALSEAMGR
jgi:lysophospholipase L1-like esterase